jgi:hypothetical protein
MATLTLYSPEANDGYVESGNVTYATMRAGSALSADNAGPIRAGQTLDTGTYYGFQFFIGPFDTSPIGGGGTINSAVLSLFLNDDDDVTNHNCRIAGISDYGTLTTADWRDAAALSALTDVATLAASSATAAQYYDFSDTGPGLASVINKTGNTYLIGYSDRQKAGTTPTNQEYMIWEGGGAGSPAPRLVVDYTAAVGGTTRRLLLTGVGSG